jgi:tetratricopeptide (TPR) repeat protein
MERAGNDALGFTLMQGGRPKEAIPHLKRALELLPDYDTAIYNLGLACFNTGDFPGALENLTKFRVRSGGRLPPDQLRAVDSLIQQCRAKLDGK